MAAELDLHQLEQQLCQIRGVMSAHIVGGDDGDIREVHILANSQRAPKQLVRDIESLALLHFKRKIDYRKISIVQLETRRVTALNRIRLKDVKREESPPSQRWTVSLEYEKQELLGMWEGKDSVSEEEGAAHATIKALQGLVGPAPGLALNEAKLAQMDGGMVVIAAVSVGNSSHQETLVGSSFVKDSVPEAAARSVLGALNRRLPFTLD